MNMNIDSYALISYKPRGDSGEDAYACNFSKSDIHSFGVFDGCGGSGAWRYSEYNNATGAFIAAQSIAKEFLNWSDSLSASDTVDPGILGIGFHDISLKVLTDLKLSCAPMGVAGTLVKSFPCTATMAIVTRFSAHSYTVSALNVGDSRVYALTPHEGLVQITKDDSRGNPDPLDSLRTSPPLSNLLNADKPFAVKSRQLKIKKPCAVLCATDGVFGYVRSPMDFEYMLLESIENANTISEFEKIFGASIIKQTGDDSTCVMAFYGFENYLTIKKSMQKRLSRIKTIIQSIDQSELSNMEKMIRNQWDSYKKTTVYDEMQV